MSVSQRLARVLYVRNSSESNAVDVVSSGYTGTARLTSCAGVAEACELLARESFDLAILDDGIAEESLPEPLQTLPHLHVGSLYRSGPVDGEDDRTQAELSSDPGRLDQVLQAREHELCGAVINNDAEAIVIAVPGHLVFVNTALCRISGYTRDELLERSFLDFIYSEDRDYLRQEHLDAFSSDNPKQWIEFRIQCADGSVKWVESSRVIIQSSSGPMMLAFLRQIDHRKAVEDRLRSLSVAADESPVGYVVTDREGTIQFVNSRFCELSGYSEEELIGETPRILKSGSVPGYVYEDLWSTILAGRTWRGELCNRHKNGDLYWAATSIQPVIDNHGEVDQFVGVCEDITVQRRSIATIADNEEKFRRIFENTSVSIWDIDLSSIKAAADELAKAGVGSFRRYLNENPDYLEDAFEKVSIHDVNPHTLEMFEADSREQFLEKVLELTSPGMDKVMTDLMIAIADRKTHFETEGVALTMKGRLARHLISAALPHRAEEYEHILICVMDITARKEAEERVASMRRFLDSVLDNIPHSVAVKDAGSLAYIFLNRAAENLIGLDRNEAIGRKDSDMFPPRIAESMAQADREVLDGEGYRDIPALVVTNQHGEERTLHTQKITINDDDGLPEYLLSISEDITELVAEQHRRRELEQEITQARQLEAVGSLASGIAHEINTPIQFVGDNTRFLAESFESLLGLVSDYERICARMCEEAGNTGVKDQITEAVEKADLEYIRAEIPLAVEQTLEGVQRVAKIVRAMKDFAHHDAKEATLVDLNELIRSTLTVARNELKYVAEVEFDLAEELPQIECHRNGIGQVLLNLFINAAHAIADVVKDTGGKGTITVHSEQDGDSVIVRIDDTGPGIPKAIRSRVFDHFFTTKEVGKGTGQGLSLSRSIVVDKHRGALTFETEEGKGTSFTMRLPIKARRPASEGVNGDSAGTDGE
ncbi:PAS domain S-box protein [candidate division GN15 bacterium]|nr:PAS domain S-box protein [candidate division GN15 bacterium]